MEITKDNAYEIAKRGCQIIDILKNHSVQVKIVDARVLAYEVATLNGKDDSRWIDVSDWSNRKLYDWLGYDIDWEYYI